MPGVGAGQREGQAGRQGPGPLHSPAAGFSWRPQRPREGEDLLGLPQIVSERGPVTQGPPESPGSGCSSSPLALTGTAVTSVTSRSLSFPSRRGLRWDSPGPSPPRPGQQSGRADRQVGGQGWPAGAGWAGHSGFGFLGAPRKGPFHGLPAPTPTGQLAGRVLAARQPPTCLWVTPGAGPDAVTHPRGPSAFLALVSCDTGSMGTSSLVSAGGGCSEQLWVLKGERSCPCVGGHVEAPLPGLKGSPHRCTRGQGVRSGSAWRGDWGQGLGCRGTGQRWPLGTRSCWGVGAGGVQGLLPAGRAARGLPSMDKWRMLGRGHHGVSHPGRGPSPTQASPARPPAGPEGQEQQQLCRIYTSSLGVRRLQPQSRPGFHRDRFTFKINLPRLASDPQQ